MMKQNKIKFGTKCKEHSARYHQGGITLLEVMVAIIIIAVVVVGLVTATITGGMWVKETTDRIVSQGIAQGEVGKLRILGYKKVLVMAGETEKDVIIDEGNPEIDNDSVMGKLTQSITQVDIDGNGSMDDILKIEITVQWEEYNRNHEQKATSLLTKRSF